MAGLARIKTHKVKASIMKVAPPAIMMQPMIADAVISKVGFCPVFILSHSAPTCSFPVTTCLLDPATALKSAASVPARMLVVGKSRIQRIQLISSNLQRAKASVPDWDSFLKTVHCNDYHHGIPPQPGKRFWTPKQPNWTPNKWVPKCLDST
jgi:hypothetical protein